jgi:hypothetical protein
MPIPNISAPVLSYLRSFDLSAVIVTRDGRLTVSRNPSGRDAEGAWWRRSGDIGRLVKLARQLDDVEAAADRLGVRLVAHQDVMQHTAMAVEKIVTRLAQAHDDGVLSFFNTTYKARRLEAQANGESFPRYATARRRLEQALVGKLMGAKTSLVDMVFD